MDCRMGGYVSAKSKWFYGNSACDKLIQIVSDEVLHYRCPFCWSRDRSHEPRVRLFSPGQNGEFKQKHLVSEVTHQFLDPEGTALCLLPQGTVATPL